MANGATIGKQKPNAMRTLRDLRIAARDGDRAAMCALLRRNGFVELTRAVQRNKPVPQPVLTMIRALTAGVGTHDKLDEWEFVNEAGEIESLLLDPPLPRTARLRPILED